MWDFIYQITCLEFLALPLMSPVFKHYLIAPFATGKKKLIALCHVLASHHVSVTSVNKVTSKG